MTWSSSVACTASRREETNSCRASLVSSAVIVPDKTPAEAKSFPNWPTMWPLASAPVTLAPMTAWTAPPLCHSCYACIVPVRTGHDARCGYGAGGTGVTEGIGPEDTVMVTVVPMATLIPADGFCDMTWSLGTVADDCWLTLTLSPALDNKVCASA